MFPVRNYPKVVNPTLMALLTLCLCLPMAGAEKKKTAVERAGYKGRVKNVTHSRFKIPEKIGKPIRERLGGFTAYKYDEKGSKLEETQYDASGKLTFKTTYKYDEKGNMLEWGACDASGSITKKTTSKYDEKGNMLERVHYDASGNLTGKTTSKYDEKGNKVAWWTYELKAGFGEKRLVSIEEETWEYTYWD